MQDDKLANAALDGVNWKRFDEYDWFEGGKVPYIHGPNDPKLRKREPKSMFLEAPLFCTAAWCL